MIEFNFDSSISEFNNLYKLPAPPAPTLPATRAELVNKLHTFANILNEEMREVEDIVTKLSDGTTTQPEILAEIADWLGDIMIYCASELTKYGIEPSAVLSIIMASNMSKLGEGGKPIYDERGKVLKGPHYWKPEEQIQRYIQARSRIAIKEQQDGK